MKQRKQRRAQPGRGSYLDRALLARDQEQQRQQKLERAYYNRRDLRAKP